MQYSIPRVRSFSFSLGRLDSSKEPVVRYRRNSYGDRLMEDLIKARTARIPLVVDGGTGNISNQGAVGHGGWFEKRVSRAFVGRRLPGLDQPTVSAALF